MYVIALPVFIIGFPTVSKPSLSQCHKGVTTDLTAPSTHLPTAKPAHKGTLSNLFQKLHLPDSEIISLIC